jgi:hypothetical protein
MSEIITEAGASKKLNFDTKVQNNLNKGKINNNKPGVFEYVDYRDFLKSFYNYAKTNGNYSYAVFAKRAHLKPSVSTAYQAAFFKRKANSNMLSQAAAILAKKGNEGIRLSLPLSSLAITL